MACSLNTSSVPEPRTSVASLLMVGSSMKRLIEMLRPNSSRNRRSMRDNRIEWPPRLKKLSSVEISLAGNSSNSAQISSNRASSALAGKRRGWFSVMLTGSSSSALRSTLPLLANGMLASSVHAVGCM